ncbi:adenosine deaminase 2-A isoform X2 [Mobula birostris]|uniref:adenosine deaminase 2-A isoform X2 n=1 Tax=Mobula birostris TaxID=1983395 RepID=UPI003B27BCEE
MARSNARSTPVLSISLCFFAVCHMYPTPDDRDKLMKVEQFIFTGGNLLPTTKEIKVNDILMKIKVKEVTEGTKAGKFPPAMHFFRAKDLIEQSTVFNILRKLPKGAALHLHDYALLNVDWLVKNATYLPNCYICFTDAGGVRFHFFLNRPEKRLVMCSEWVLLENYRRQLKNVTEFDNSLIRNLTLVTEKPEEAYRSQGMVWRRFEDLFQAASSLISYALVFKTYFYEALREFYHDNVLYIEIRALLLLVYELNGTLHDKEWSIRAYQEVTRQFQHDYPDFMGAKVIFSTPRKYNNSFMKTTINEAMMFQQKFPEIIAGFDMVLMLITDLRNHPAANLMAEGHPLVISSDDPAAFGARGLSYDFYEAFMGIGGLKAELTTLKQLALNSIKYSAMSVEMKVESIELWLKKWDEFLDEVLNMFNRNEL